MPLVALSVLVVGTLTAAISPPAPEPTVATTNPLIEEAGISVDLCTLEGAAIWGLDLDALAAERTALGIDCSSGAVIGEVDEFGRAIVDLDQVDVPLPASSGPAMRSFQGVDATQAPAAVALLGYYSTAPAAEAPAGELVVIPESITLRRGVLRGRVRNQSDHVALNVRISAGRAETVHRISVQPGEDFGFELRGPIPKRRRRAIRALTVEAEWSDQADFGRSVAITETFESRPDRLHALLASVRPDGGDFPLEANERFGIDDAVMVVTSLDRRGRVLDVATQTLASPLDSDVVQQRTRNAASVIINVGGRLVRQPADSEAEMNATGRSGVRTLTVTEGTYRGMTGAVDTLYGRGHGCPAVSKTNLLAVLLAIPAHEVRGFEPPAPATFSRGDNIAVDSRNERLYSFKRNNGRYPRAFWTPGIGIYQLDTLNLQLDAATKANTRRATLVVGKMLLDRWCDNGVTAMRTFLASTWHACAGDACYSTSRNFYDSASDRLNGIALAPGNAVAGGVASRYCWSADRPHLLLRCSFFDVSRLQGEMNMIAPDGGSGPNPYTPLPADFVVFELLTDDGPMEARVFMSGNTGYSREIWALRPDGANPRTSLRWYSQTWSSFDGDLAVWSCSNFDRAKCSWSTTLAR